MVISELAKHMIATGSGVNPNTVPEWFVPVVITLKDIPQLSQMGQAQMEFLIRRYMEVRCCRHRSEIVSNVLFGIPSVCESFELRKIEKDLFGYKALLDTEWKKLNKIIPIEFQYAALSAYAESL